MQFEMRLNTLVLRIKSQATLYSSEEFSPAIFPDLDIYIYICRAPFFKVSLKFKS